jgi:TadE-like protein
MRRTTARTPHCAGQARHTGRRLNRRRTAGWRLIRRPGDDAGAAAVEFALVSFVLFLVLFGIIDYGLYFSDALDTRSGVASATRQAVVGTFDPTCVAPPTDGTISDDVGHLLCMVKARTNPLAGKTYVKVILPTDPKNAEPGTGWYPGGAMVVCEETVVIGVSGFVPLPGPIHTRLVAQIEQHPGDQPSDLADDGGAEPPPPDGWDSWCTAPASP